MTDHAAVARDSALSCEAKKIAYRQSKDGIVVSFLLHPQEPHDALAKAVLGTRYLLALVELDDDDTPKQPQSSDGKTLAATNAAEPAPVVVPPERPRAVTLAQRAGMLCKEPAFFRFLQERQMCVEGDSSVDALRFYCGVSSRADIRPGTPAAVKFEALAYDYAGWKAEASTVPA